MGNGEWLFASAMRDACRLESRGSKLSKRNKRRLLLSVAVAALLTAPAFASSSSSTDSDTTINKDDVCVTGITCITSKTTSALKTSEKGNVYVFYDDDKGYGQIVIGKENKAAVTIDSNNYLYSNGVVSNNGTSNAYGIKIDLTKNPNASALAFENYELDTITGSAIYLDADSNLDLGGNGSNKVGILLDG